MKNASKRFDYVLLWVRWFSKVPKALGDSAEPVDPQVDIILVYIRPIWGGRDQIRHGDPEFSSLALFEADTWADLDSDGLSGPPSVLGAQINQWIHKAHSAWSIRRP
jgi:hypothetical protein